MSCTGSSASSTALRDRNQQLVEQVQQLEDRGSDPGGVEVPPHY